MTCRRGLPSGPEFVEGRAPRPPVPETRDIGHLVRDTAWCVGRAPPVTTVGNPAQPPGGGLAEGSRPDPPQWGAARWGRHVQCVQSRQSRGERETEETEETERTSAGPHERLLSSTNRQRLPVGPGVGCHRPPGRPWGIAGGACPFAAGNAVISAVVPIACESEKTDALRWRTRDGGGLARPMVPRIQICSQSPV